MAFTSLATASEKQVFDDEYFVEYVRDSFANDAMGTDENSIIQIKEQLGKEQGDKINIPLFTRLTGSGVTGDSTLHGNEEAASNYNHQLTIDALANAVLVGKMEQQRTEMDLLKAGRKLLKMWSMDDLRTDIITALTSPNLDGKTSYGSSTAAQRNSFAAANQDRLLFGAATSNYSATFATALGNVDSTSDKFTTSALELMKYIAKHADPHIRPVKIKGGREVFVVYANSLAFRDFRSSITTPLEYAGVRGDENPLFADGDIPWAGCIVKEVEEMGVISGVGASSIDVAQVVLCGAQAVAVGWGQRPKLTAESFDYGRQDGVAIDEIRGVERLMFNSKVHGCVLGYFSGVAG